MPLQVIAGDDRGKVGKIVKVHTKIGKVLIEGVNVKVSRHLYVGSTVGAV